MISLDHQRTERPSNNYARGAGEKSKSSKTGFAARSPQPPGGDNSNNDGSGPTPMHEATKENLLALIAESDDDEPAPAPARPAKKPRYFEDVEPEDDADEDA